MKYDPKIHHRKSMRLKSYDYSNEGLYFITICIQDRECLFGEIIYGEMILNDAGKMIEKWYYKLENKFPDIRCYEMIIMPNHFHCIIENVGANLRVRPEECVRQNDKNNNEYGTVGANLRVRPEECVRQNDENNNENATVGANLRVRPEEWVDTRVNPNNNIKQGEQNNIKQGEHMGSPLHRVVQWFKTMTTNEYIRGVKSLHWTPFNGKLWQRNYWEHIIRNENENNHISNYIINNPKKWDNDKLKS